MKKSKKLYIGGLAIMTGMLFASCGTDNDYDLDNIDGEGRISVNNLVIPINISPAKLETMLNVKDDSKIKKDTIYESDGKTIKDIQYAVKESGTFSSDGVSVHTSEATCDAASDTQTGINFYSGTANIKPSEIDINVSSEDIDEAVKSVDYIYFKEGTTISMGIQFDGIPTDKGKLYIKNLVIKAVKGLNVTNEKSGGYKYNPETGYITVATAETDVNHKYALSVEVSSIDCKAADIVLDYENHSIKKTFETTVESGTITVADNNYRQIGITQRATNDLQNGTITKVTGYITYYVKNVKVDPVDLSNIPDVLQQSGTSIELSNPQVTLECNNPLYEAGYNDINVKTGINLVGNDTYSTSDNAIVFNKAKDKKVIAPSDPQKEGYEWVQFEDMKKILTGNDSQGLPKTIEIGIIKPRIDQEVTEFRLGETYNKLDGTWNFYTPLSLTSNSHINYVKEWDSWSSDEMKYLTLESATVTFDAVNEVPLDIQTIKFAVNGNGDDKSIEGTCGDENHPVLKAAGTEGSSQTVTIPLGGSGKKVSDLTGAKITCYVKGANGALKPSQTITVSNMKMKVNGYYQKKF